MWRVAISGSSYSGYATVAVPSVSHCPGVSLWPGHVIKVFVALVFIWEVLKLYIPEKSLFNRAEADLGKVT